MKMTKFSPPMSCLRMLIGLLGLMLCASSSIAQVSVTATAGDPGPTAYTTVKDAFDAVNAGTHQGDITIDVSANTAESAPAVLNSTGAGSALYTSVLIRPSADGVTITGAPRTGRGVIELNGADNVTIDGDNPGSGGINRDLTINNTAANTVIANSAVRIAVSAAVTSADNNTVKNCNLNGNVTGGNSSLITSTTGSSNSSFGIYVGGNGGATATGAPTAITSVTSNSAPSGTTINGLVIDNNAVNQCARGIVFIGAATTVSTGVTITNNVLGASGTPSPAIPPYTSPATTVYTKGIYVAGTAAVTVTGNTIQNQMSYVATANTCIEMNAAIGTSVNISNNTITNHTQNATSSAPKSILISSASGAYTVSNNTVTSTQSMAGSSGTAAIECGGTATSGTIELNKVTTVYSRSTGTWGCFGINVTAGTNITVKNNFVSDLKMDMTGGAAFSTTFGVHGIRIGGGTLHKVYHNSVNLDGTMFGTANTSILSSACTIVGTGQTGVDVRNNIFSNTMSGGTTSIAHVSLFLPSAATVAMNLTLNNNAYYCGGDSARQGIGQAGITAGTNFFLPANFNPGATSPASNMRAYTSPLSAAGTNDDNSLASTGAAPFTSATNLHIPAATVTELESKGAAVGVATDIDGEARPGPAGSVNGGAIAPDLGADEFDGTPGEGTPPGIAFTALGNTSSTGSRTLSAAITDATGVPTAGIGLPVLYWKVNAGAYAAATATYISGSQYDFSFGSGVSTGDVVSYYIVAQDTAPSLNVGSNPSAGAGGFTANPPAAATPPTTPSSYVILGTITGTKTVGLGGDYADLAAMANALNFNVITRPVVFNLIDASYTLAGPLVINANSGSSAVNTVTIKPAVAGVTITGSSTAALIQLNGADFMTIDGSTTGATANAVGGNAAIRELTIQNTSTATSAVVLAVASGTDGAQNITIRNVNVLGQDSLTTLIGIALGGNTLGTAGTDNDNNRVENCSVKRSIFGIYSAGISAANPNTGTVITMNETSAVAGDRIRRIGIAVFNDNGVQITKNSLNGISTNESADGIGIAVGSQFVSTTDTTSGGITNALVARNKIDGVASLSTIGFSAAGITVSGATGGANTIVNNMISGVTAPSTSPDIVAGIYVVGATGSSTRLYHNSISMTGDRGAVASQTPGYGVAITGVDPTVELRNNILYTTQTSGGGVNAKSYAIGMVSTTFVNLDSNYNDFFSTGANDGGFRTGSLTAAAGTDYATLALWQAAVSDDANSLEVDPLFVNPLNDLHLGASSPMLGVGVTLGSVVDDIDGELRDTPPDIGADEIIAAAPPCPGDTNNDGFVNVTDLLAVISAWGTCITHPTPPCTADVAPFGAPDGLINVTDLLFVISNWGTCP